MRLSNAGSAPERFISKQPQLHMIWSVSGEIACMLHDHSNICNRKPKAEIKEKPCAPRCDIYGKLKTEKVQSTTSCSLPWSRPAIYEKWYTQMKCISTFDYLLLVRGTLHSIYLEFVLFILPLFSSIFAHLKRHYYCCGPWESATNKACITYLISDQVSYDRITSKNERK